MSLLNVLSDWAVSQCKVHDAIWLVDLSTQEFTKQIDDKHTNTRLVPTGSCVWKECALITPTQNRLVFTCLSTHQLHPSSTGCLLKSSESLYNLSYNERNPEKVHAPVRNECSQARLWYASFMGFRSQLLLQVLRKQEGDNIEKKKKRQPP